MSETPGTPEPNAETPAEAPPSGPSYGTPPPTAQPPSYGTPPAAPPPGYGAPPAGQPGHTAGGGAGRAPLSDSDRRMWAMLANLGGIILSFIAPLIVYLIYKDQDEYVKDQSTEALNFQITVIIAYVAASVLSTVGIGFLLFPIIWVGNVVFCIIAGLADNRGERYRYPFTLRLVK